MQAADLVRRATTAAFLAGLAGGTAPRPKADAREAAGPPTATPRPVGTEWEKLLPGNPADPRSHSYRAVYRVVGHRPGPREGEAVEVVQRVKFERV